MSSTHKTDNGKLGNKLQPRRWFLDRYHSGTRPRVFDACQGSGVIWSYLRKDWDCSYWGVDVKPKKGRLAIDSARILAQSGWEFDVVDLDTYGAPWRHWKEVLKNAPGPITVFLTIGATLFRGSTDRIALDAVGLEEIAENVPIALCGKLSEITVDYCLAMSYTYGWEVESCREAPPNKRTRYIGIRLTPTTNGARATGGTR